MERLDTKPTSIPEIDHGLEQTIGNLLRAGVTGAALIVLAGAVVYLVRHGAELPSYASFKAEPEDLSTLSGIIRGVRSLHGRSIMMGGLIVLILTPIARVVLALAAFALRKDYLYTMISAIVLIILLLSFFDVI